MSENRYRSLTVGHSNADIVGDDGMAIQTAVDALAFRGGGTVYVQAGEYTLYDAIRLRANVALIGEAGKTILRRGPLLISPLAKDVDRSQTEITPVNAAGFKPGMGVIVYDENRGWGMDEPPQFITHIDNGVLYLGAHAENERLAECDGKVANYFPMVYSYCQENIVLDGFVIDATTDQPDEIKGASCHGICLYRSPNGVIRNVEAFGSLGDGITFSKSSVDGLIENCHTHHNKHNGIHPGSHSARITVRHCEIDNNGSDGLYICWGISNGLFEENHIHHNGWDQFRSGLSIGHKDTDNILRKNHIHDNVKFGICIRRKTQANGAHRNVFSANLIENNGSKPTDFAELKKQIAPWETIGCGVNIQGVTEDLVFEKNIIRETREGKDAVQQHGVCIGEGVTGEKFIDNEIEGHPGEPITRT